MGCLDFGVWETPPGLHAIPGDPLQRHWQEDLGEMDEQVPWVGVLQAFRDHKLSGRRLAAQRSTEQNGRAWAGCALALRAACLQTTSKGLLSLSVKRGGAEEHRALGRPRYCKYKNTQPRTVPGAQETHTGSSSALDTVRGWGWRQERQEGRARRDRPVGHIESLSSCPGCSP